MVGKLGALAVEGLDISFLAAVVVHFLDDLLLLLVESLHINEITPGPTQVHGSVTFLVLRGKLLKLDRLLVLAPKALKTVVASAPDAVGSRPLAWKWRPPNWDLRGGSGSRRLGEELINLGFLPLICRVRIEGRPLYLLLEGLDIFVDAPERLNRWRLLGSHIDSRLSGCKETGSALRALGL